MLSHELRSPDSFVPAELDQLFALMSDNYRNLDHRRFLADLAAKTGVIVLRDSAGLIRGFSTYLIYREADLGCSVIYSGDTVIHPDNWGSPALFYGFGGLLKQLLADLPAGERAWWFLISKGIRTYGMLPLFFRTFVPHLHETDGAPWDELRRLRDQLALRKFGRTYQRETGLIPAGADYLNDDLAEVSEHKEHNPWVRFFLERNPDYRLGTELACLTEISLDNIQPPARRFVR